jgi:hypothetical protein
VLCNLLFTLKYAASQGIYGISQMVK